MCKRRHISAILVILLIVLAACQEKSASYVLYDSFNADDLVGSWRVDYSEYDQELSGIETIDIYNDGSFIQSFVSSSESFASKSLPWSLARLSNGIAQLHLEGGIELPQIFISLSETDIEQWKNTVYSLVDPASNERVTFSQEAIINILVDPQGNLLLCHLPAGDPDSPVIICFSKQ